MSLGQLKIKFRRNLFMEKIIIKLIRKSKNEIINNFFKLYKINYL